MKKKGIEEKHCICATCGSQMSDPDNGYCINGHDDWLELEDNVEIFLRASKNTGMSIEEIRRKINS